MDRSTHETVYRSQPDPEVDPHAGASAAAGRRSHALRDAGHEAIAGLERAIDEEIVPRLIDGHRMAADSVRPAQPHVPAIGAGEVVEFANITLEADLNSVFVFVNRLRGRSVSLESVYLDLLAPAARHLGELWESDRVDFTDVTMGVGRMQQVLRDLNAEFRSELECARHGRRLLLAPAPGEQHTFGLFIVEDFFARAGWDVWGGPCAPGDNVFRLVRDEWFDVVGLSVGSALRLTVLTEDIRELRTRSRNPGVAVLVGGPVFSEHPEYAETVGADGTAADGRQAPVVAEQLVAQRAAARARQD